MKKLTGVIAFTIALFISVTCLAGSKVVSSTLASAIITNARSYLNESTASFWTDAQLLVWLNNGTLDIAARSHCLETIETKTLHQDVTNYPISGPFITVKNVIYRNTDEKVTNGTMEINANWSSVGTPSAQAQSTAQVYHDTYSRMFTPDSEDEGIKSAVWTSVNSTTYYYRLIVYSDDQTSVNVYIQKGDDSASIVDTDVTVKQDAWHVITGSFTEGAATGGAGAYIEIRSPTGITSGDYYVDDVSVYTSETIQALKKGAIETIGHATQVSGQPVFWTQWGNEVMVYPAPDSTTTGDFIDAYLVTRPTAILSTANVPVPAQYDKALTLYIVEQGLIKDEMYGKAAKIRNDYLAEIDRYRQDFNTQLPAKDVR